MSPLSSEASTEHSHLVGAFAAGWGVVGFSLLLAVALLRLTAVALDSFESPWNALHYAVFVLNLVFMGYTEGYKGFQNQYSPRFAARILYLYRHATVVQALFAPLVAMGFFNATRRRLLTAWILTAGVVVLVLIYRSLPQPWRGILDAGVVLGLGWGLLATLWAVLQAFRVGTSIDPEFS